MRNITGVILAGGKSRRMGFDKGLIKWNGMTLTEHMCRKMDRVCNEVIIIANNEGYEKMGYPVYNDCVSGKGPAGGIYTGLSYMSNDYGFFISCDTPSLPNELIKYILHKSVSDYDAFVPVFEGKLQPLCAIYSKESLSSFGRCIREGRLRMSKIIKELNTKYIDIDPGADFYSRDLFLNVNTQQDFKNLISSQTDEC